MIFCSINEKGEHAWQMVMDGRKTITRRTKPQPVGAIRAVCPNRGKKAVCRIKILSCEDDETWFDAIPSGPEKTKTLQEEARREGFYTWDNVWAWIRNKYGETLPTIYRIEFEKVD